MKNDGEISATRLQEVWKRIGKPRARGVKKEVNVPEALKLRLKGASWAQLCELYGVSKPTLKARIREDGEVRRSPPPSGSEAGATYRLGSRWPEASAEGPPEESP